MRPKAPPAMKKGEPGLETRVTSLVTRPSLFPVFQCANERRGEGLGELGTSIAFYISNRVWKSRRELLYCK